MNTMNANIIQKSAPHLRRPQANVTRMMRDVTIALLPVTAFAIYRFGMSALMILVLSILSMVVTEYLYYQFADLKNGESFKLKNKSFTLYDFSAITSGLIYGLILPDNTSWFVVIIGGIVGMYVGKLIFGGLGNNIFNVAGFARVFVTLSLGAFMTYEIDTVAGATALGALNNNPFMQQAPENFELINLFTGIGIPGSLGEVSALLLIVGGIYLALRTSFEVRIPLVYIGTVFVLALSVALFKGIGMWYPLYHIFSGGLFIGAIYMATDPITSPITKPGRIYYAFALGFVTFIIRLFGSYPEGVVFSILIMNMFVSSIDYHKWSHSRFTKKALYIFGAVIVLAIATVLIGVQYAS